MSNDAANGTGSRNQAPASAPMRSSAPEVPSKPNIDPVHVPSAQRTSSTGMLTRRPASAASVAGLASDKEPRRPPPGFEALRNAQQRHQRSSSAGGSTGGHSSAPAVVAAPGKAVDHRLPAPTGTAAAKAWQNVTTGSNGGTLPSAWQQSPGTPAPKPAMQQSTVSRTKEWAIKPVLLGSRDSHLLICRVSCLAPIESPCRRFRIHLQVLSGPPPRDAKAKAGPPVPYGTTSPPAVQAAAAVHVPACSNAACLAGKGC
jgi:hypothetical protein